MNEKICYADCKMQPELIRLWQEAFGDEKEYIEFYFRNRFTENMLLVYLEDNHPVSMLSLLPVRLHCGTKRVPARYVYAVATAKAYRGRGYAKRLIETAKELTKEPLLLKPGDDSLMEYYRKIGFHEAFCMCEYNLEIPEQSDRESMNGTKSDETELWKKKEQRYWLLTITPKEYRNLRNQHFAGDGYVEWDEEAISYALMENEWQEGYAYKVFHDDKEDILLYRMEEDCMKIMETTLSDADICGVLEKLRMHPKRVHIRRPMKEGTGEKRSFGMLWSDCMIKDGYLNLTLE